MAITDMQRIVEELDRSGIGEVTATQIKSWIARLAAYVGDLEATLLKPTITEQPYGYIEGSGNIRYVEAHGGPGYLAQQLDQSRVRKLEAALAEEQKRHKVTQAQLEKFLSACAEAQIERRNATGSPEEIKLRAECAKLNRYNTELGEQLSSHVQGRNRLREVIKVRDGEDIIEAAIEHINAPCEDCKALAAQLDAAADPLPPPPDDIDF